MENKSENIVSFLCSVYSFCLHTTVKVKTVLSLWNV